MQSIVPGHMLAQPQKIRYPTGVFELDARIGGGIPKGRFTLITGDESCWKTTLCIKTAAAAQRRCRHCQASFKFEVDARTEDVKLKVKAPCSCGKNAPNMVVYVDIEGTLDIDYMRALGFIPELALIIQPDFAEQGVDVLDAMLRSGAADIIILDSIAAMTPTVEVEENADKQHMGVQARLINKMCRKLNSAMNSLGATNEMKPAVLWINQKREKLGVMWGDPETLPGGKGQRFYASLRIDMRQGKLIRMSDDGREMESKGMVVGRTFFWKIKKCKVGNADGSQGEFKYFKVTNSTLGTRTGAVNNEEKIIECAKLHGLIEVSGAKHVYGSTEVRGQAKFIATLKAEKLWGKLKAETAVAISASAPDEETE